MKKLTTLWMMVVMLALCLPASAMSKAKVRENARFLTDRMAYELNLSPMQYDDVYEVNYDFIDNVRYIMDDVVRGYDDAMNHYYECLDYRNDDLRWILNVTQYRRFMKADYFYRPIYTTGNNWKFRIYLIYKDVHHFYFDKPHHYKSYKGGHYRTHFGNVSFYKTHRKEHYKHEVYRGDIRQKHNPGTLKPNHAPGKPGAANKPGVNAKPKPERKPSAAAQAGRRPAPDRNASVSSGNKKTDAVKPSESRPKQEVKKSAKRDSRTNVRSNSRSENKEKQQEGRRATRGR